MSRCTAPSFFKLGLSWIVEYYNTLSTPSNPHLKHFSYLGQLAKEQLKRWGVVDYITPPTTPPINHDFRELSNLITQIT